MEIAYNANDIGNPDRGDFTYDILVDVDLPPTPPDRLPEMPINPQRGPQWPRFIHPYPAPVATVVGEGDTPLTQFTRSRRYRETIPLHLLIAMGNGT